MNSKTKFILGALILLGVDLFFNGVNYRGFSWIYSIEPTQNIFDFSVSGMEVFISLAVGLLWNAVIILLYRVFATSPLTKKFSRNKKAFTFGWLLIGFCIGDRVSNFWAILKIPGVVTFYWVCLTVAINLAKTYILAYYYGNPEKIVQQKT